VLDVATPTPNNKNPKRQGDPVTELFWRIGGERGRELHGWAVNEHDEFSTDDLPDIVVKAGSAVWDFTFEGVNGTGRCRVGNGCAYNPLHLIEAIYRFVKGHHDAPTLEDIQMNPDFQSWQKSMEDEWA